MTSPTRSRRSVCRRRLCRAGALAAACLLAACSSVPDAVNPVEWYKTASDAVSGDGTGDTAASGKGAASAKPAETPAVPGADKPYPNLASVPEAPARTTAAEEKRMADGLIADREHARYTDEVIRRQSAEIQPLPDTPPKPAVLATLGQSAAAAPTTPPPTPSRPAAAPAKAATAVEARAPSGVVGTAVSATAPASAPRPAQPAPPVVAETLSAPPAPAPVPPAVAARPPPPEAVQVARAEPAPVAKRPPPAAAPQVARAEPAPASERPPPPPAIPTVGADRAPRDGLDGIAPAGGAPSRPPRAASADGSDLVFGPPPSDIDLVQRSRRRHTQAAFAAPEAASAPRVAAPVNGTAVRDGVGDPFDRPGGRRLGIIDFESGSAAIGQAGHDLLRKVVADFRRSGGTIRIVGHASSWTKDMNPARHSLINFKLSLDRANSVARSLMSLGVPARSIYVEAMSDAQPRFDEVMPRGEAGNRRVEIYLVTAG